MEGPVFLELAKSVFIDWQKTYINLGSSSNFNHEFDITPVQFLRFAQNDLKEKSIYGFANALTNAKRAIDCQADRVLLRFGYPLGKPLPTSATDFVKNYEKQNGKVESSIQLRLLRALNIAPTILVSRSRHARHDLEHRYKLPESDALIEALELADLFIRATEPVIQNLMSDLTWGSQEKIHKVDPYVFGRTFNYCLYTCFENKDTSINVTIWKKSNMLKKQYSIKPDDRLYLPLIKFLVTLTLQHDGREALAEFLSAAGSPIPPEKVGLEVFY